MADRNTSCDTLIPIFSAPQPPPPPPPPPPPYDYRPYCVSMCIILINIIHTVDIYLKQNK